MEELINEDSERETHWTKEGILEILEIENDDEDKSHD